MECHFEFWSHSSSCSCKDRRFFVYLVTLLLFGRFVGFLSASEEVLEKKVLNLEGRWFCNWHTLHKHGKRITCIFIGLFVLCSCRLHNIGWLSHVIHPTGSFDSSVNMHLAPFSKLSCSCMVKFHLCTSVAYLAKIACWRCAYCLLLVCNGDCFCLFFSGKIFFSL